jgi:tRNA pseudouridine38-40 synthase
MASPARGHAQQSVATPGFTAMRTIRLVVQYDGTDYAGFQIQPDVPTIQAELERALGHVLQHGVHLKAAGRTDAGVHALGKVVALNTENPIAPSRLVRAANDVLPLAVSVVGGEEVDESFHPQHDATGKLYCYRILNRPLPSPFIGRYAWHIQVPLSEDAMDAAAERLLGCHDFSAFEASGSSVQYKVRCLQRLDCERVGEIIEFWATGDGFLYMMVRNIVGTLVEVGTGRLEPDDVERILVSRDRSHAGPTAPPEGLCLVRVDY